ncbi:helix-turn-helix transcriptional regulator [Geodermatophilus sabuli]|uniref:Helix-turn-helix n=1 Tax=Geodermatophilus sabuli TaxID=1564158 RepID=A0A285ECR3_9ACTN|nr:helix-turn-helix domain-containing protein [Geodermatophilus sabuli]MBB3083499.1 DNA-binding XRE family transcriptional regulator [Geodermatophilus sabuli]SNX96780.1 Helix-turn-helix [Geodermatophilus sabuli]
MRNRRIEPAARGGRSTGQTAVDVPAGTSDDGVVTRRELADALGVHYRTVGHLERGGYDPSLHLALRLAEFFGLPVEVVFSTRAFADQRRRPAVSEAG